MALTPGTKLGPYEIQSSLGAGGMGEVYRARDSKLGRDVAIKVLPDAFARDADRMTRFEREAKVLASLNHPNIASIYGLEDSDATHALVMELVEGPTLADRIRQGPIPMEEAVPIAKQICDALEYAHERGIVHRDLKPANVKVTVDDAVKVLDFGLAKAIEGDAASSDVSNSPTMSRMATLAGVLLGTAAYMSPEQAKAKPVDRRADIWAFGCVLYEMFTGKTSFPGESVTDTLAAVIKEEPDWSSLPAATPMRVRVLLRRCLQKDPKQRLRDIGDARISLEEVLTGASEGTASIGVAGPTRRRLLPWAAAIFVAGVALAGVAVWILKPAPARPVTRAVITLPAGQQLAGLGRSALALSPDGSHLAYVATTIQPGGTQQIYLRAMDSVESKFIPGTEGAVDPFFSPDGKWLGFYADGKLKKVSVSGGAAQALAEASTSAGASWSSQGVIAFTPTAVSYLQQVSDAGGAPKPLTRTEKGDGRQRWPDFLPGGKALLFAASQTGSNWTMASVVVQSVGTGEWRKLIEGTSPRYASSGHLVYAQGGNLMAVPFDARRLEFTGAPVLVVEGVFQSQVSGVAEYSVSSTGSLVYVAGGIHAAQKRLVWVSRTGVEQPLAAPAHSYVAPRLSPDGRRVAVAIQERDTQIWLYDLSRETLTPLTFEGDVNSSPTWTPDGKRIAFTSTKDGPLNIFWQLADGSGGLEKLNTSENAQIPMSWSPDGKLLAFLEVDPTTGYDIGVLRLDEPSAGSGQGRKSEQFLRTRFSESVPRFSPDGRWLAYISDESGRYEIYVQPYPGPGGKRQISAEGGTEPVWNPNGRELFYRSGEKMMSVEVTTQPSFAAGKPRMLFEGRYEPAPLTNPNYAVSPDGQRFLMLKPAEHAEDAPTQINIVLNWFEELNRLVPPGK
jgi:Tol biopolymer transport system component